MSSTFQHRLREALGGQSPRSAARAIAPGGLERTIYGYLRGEHVPTLGRAIAFAAYFGCTLDWLVGLADTGGPTSAWDPNYKLPGQHGWGLRVWHFRLPATALRRWADRGERHHETA